MDAKPGDWLKKSTDAATSAPKRDLSVDPDVIQVEKWIQGFAGVKYSELLELPLATIDEKKSRQNQARRQAIIQDTVDRLVPVIKRGDPIKPVIGYKSGSRVVLIDGNNRDAAHRKAGASTIRAFLVHDDTPSEIILAMTVSANVGGGVVPELSHRLLQAVHLRSLGFPIESVCEWAAVTSRQLVDHERMEKSQLRSKSLKIHGFDALPTATKLKLAALPADPVFIQAARVVIDSKMTADETAALVRGLKACPDEAAQIRLIGRTAQSREIEAKARKALGKPIQVKSAKLGLITGLGKIMSADIGAIARQVITDIERAEMLRRLEEAGERIMELQIAIEASNKEARNVC